MHIISIGFCDMMYVCVNCSDGVNAQQPHVPAFLPPEPLLQNEAHYLGLVSGGRKVDSILLLLYVGATIKPILLQSIKNIY